MTLKIVYFAVTCALVFFLALALERPAYAYADPGSAVLIVQSVSAIVSGSLFYFRKRLKHLIDAVRRRPEPEKSCK
jgi:hypothetical protein